MHIDLTSRMPAAAMLVAQAIISSGTAGQVKILQPQALLPRHTCLLSLLACQIHQQLSRRE